MCLLDRVAYLACCDPRLGLEGNVSCWGPGRSFDECCSTPGMNFAAGCGACRWASERRCLRYSGPIRGATNQTSLTAVLGARCFELCCGDFTALIERAARKSPLDIAALEQNFSLSIEEGSSSSAMEHGLRSHAMAANEVTSMETSRRCHLHTEAASFCEYENLCLARAEASWALVALRAGHGRRKRVRCRRWAQQRRQHRQRANLRQSADASWAMLLRIPAESSHGSNAAPAPAPLDVDYPAVLPAGFYWPAFLRNESVRWRSMAVGWAQPTPSSAQKIIWHGYSEAGANRQTALFLGIDPWFGASNLFHFAQIVLPAFSARIRLAWASGSPGLVKRPLPFDVVVLADPSGVTNSAWQRGLLHLITGGAPVISAELPHTRTPSLQMHCYRSSVLTGLAPRSMGTTGRLDHVELLLEMARYIPGAGLPRRPATAPPQDVIFLRRLAVPFQRESIDQAWLGSTPPRELPRRAISNEVELLAAIRSEVRALTGRKLCLDGAPCVRVHGGSASGDGSFAQQVLRFSRSMLMVGAAGAGTVNMIFMPPQSVLLLLQPIGMREDYVAMAFGCGHFAIPFFVACAEDPRDAKELLGIQLQDGYGKRSRVSARNCAMDRYCKNRLNALCRIHVDIPAFKPILRAAFSHAYRGMLAVPDLVSERVSHEL
eukprot:TRINITY_DN45743_c0_g1_i1.p1 TRINITY_DN45743_c0_g1~~TRINITY_DN45743_c0_g1_i1.p1  ORF type:complete len:661 (+),score=87.66 TRINITY_DN45743_c0_g1_i1:66-2048(+)